MLCSKPFRKDGREFGCGQCLPCRFNKRRVLTSRLMLESLQHEVSEFVTLTYDEEHLPDDGSLSVRALQLFNKRVRQHVAPLQLRFFGVGEYGDETGRPHYHVALFGLRSGHPLGWRGRCECGVCRAWRYGAVHSYDLSRFLAQYLCGYSVKKMTRKDDPRLNGRHPEFARWSCGLGKKSAETMARALVDKETGEIHEVDGDVVSQFRMDRKLWPMGRYLMQKARLALGGDGKQPVQAAELQKLYELFSYPTWRDRERKEEAREQGARKAYAREQISRSKKTL